MERRKLVLTVEIESLENVKALKEKITEALEDENTDVVQIQANVIKVEY